MPISSNPSLILGGSKGQKGHISVTVDETEVVNQAYALANNGSNRITTFDLKPGSGEIAIMVTPENAPETQLRATLSDMANWTQPLFAYDQTIKSRLDAFFAGIEDGMEDTEMRMGFYGSPPSHAIKTLHEISAAAGLSSPPDALREFTELPFNIDMGGGVFCGPGSRAIDNMPEVQDAVGAAPATYGLTQPMLDMLTGLYQRSATVLADGNHFNGIIWDPIGIDAQTAKACDLHGPIQGPDGVFWAVAEEAGSWKSVRALKSADGSIMPATEAVTASLLPHLDGLQYDHRYARELDDSVLCYDSQYAAELRVYGNADGWAMNLEAYPPL